MRVGAFESGGALAAGGDDGGSRRQASRAICALAPRGTMAYNPPIMDISSAEALSVFRKWQQEKRLIQAGVYCRGRTSCTIVGRLEDVSDSKIWIDRSTLDRWSGHVQVFALYLDEADDFRFEDWRDAPLEHAEQLHAAYDSFIFAGLPGGWHCEFYAAKLGDELAESLPRDSKG